MKYIIVLLITFILASPAMAENLVYTTRPLQIITENAKYDFTVEVADTDEKREHGLMFRKKMAEENGMLFLFDQEMPISMWMKDTYIPLDILFIKKDGTIATIAENTTPLSLKTISSVEKVSATLELKAGICKKLGIKKNDRIIF